MVTVRANPGSSIERLLRGLAFHFAGARFLLRTRALWWLAFVPVLLSGLALLAVTVLLWNFAGEIFQALTSWMPVLDVEHWFEWLWVAPAKFLIWCVGLLLFAAVTGVALILALLLANVVASPVLDTLSQRVEALASGVVPVAEEGFWPTLATNLRTVGEDLRRIAFFLALQALISFCGLVIPGAQLIAPIVMTGVVILFLPLEYASYALDRRQLAFRERRRWALAHKPEMLGFGGGAFLLCLVPGLNLCAMPVLVVSATLLVVHLSRSPSADLVQ